MTRAKAGGASSGRRLGRVLLGVATWGAVAALLTTVGCADWFLLHPSTRQLNAPSALRLTVESENGAIEVLTRPTDRAKVEGDRAYVLAFCGNAGRAERAVGRVSGRWRDYPVTVWAVNYPGYGGSAGPSHLRDLAAVAARVFDELRAVAGPRPIFIEGNSLGTTVALHLAAHRDVAGLVLQNPPPLRELIVGRHGWWNLWLLALPVAWSIPDELDSLANAGGSRAPALIYSARHDDIVPPDYQRRVIDAYQGPKWVIDIDGGHNDRPDHDGWRGYLDRLWTSAFPAESGR